MPPAAPGGRPNRLRAEDDQDEADDAAHDGEKRELQTVAAEAVDEGWADAQADPVHEQVVEHRLGEVIERQLHAVGRPPDREAAADDDGSRDHAEAVAADTLAPQPDRQAHGEEQQDERIGPEKLEEARHDGWSFCAFLRARLREPRMAGLESLGLFRLGGEHVGTQQFEPLRGLVAVDLLHIELAHEVDRLDGQHLPGHHDRESREGRG